ncbi:GET complex subunit get1 [Emydomyces testavorans]|uniref:GET complex subunit get1 n=1 Tax=Emydomyces testavorans TaxID=2070801 RepID=A0AAF0DBQ8_9EURO|nr:GET complex subunit get1 [Emydomyces testavorans]
MASLLVIVLIIHIAAYLINTIGANTIDSLLWLLYLRLPHQTSQTAKEQRQLKREVMQLKREMNATSSQDEFAKWAKLKRRHDKSMEQYEAKIRFFSTTGVKFFLQFWYSKEPMFELPRGWLPWQIEWVLSFPRAPLGTVSIQIWSGVCATVVSLVGDAVGVVILSLIAKSPQKKDDAKKLEQKSAGPMATKKEL